LQLCKELIPFAALQLGGANDAVEVRIHTKHSCPLKPIQFGLFATAAHAKGDRVTAYGGILRHQDCVKPESHGRRVPSTNFVLDGWPLALMYERPTFGTDAALHKCLQQGMEPLLPSAPRIAETALARFRGSASGYMANTAGDDQCNNVCIAYTKVRVGDVTYDVPILKASRAIAENDEILSPYRNKEEKIFRAQQQLEQTQDDTEPQAEASAADSNSSSRSSRDADASEVKPAAHADNPAQAEDSADSEFQAVEQEDARDHDADAEQFASVASTLDTWHSSTGALMCGCRAWRKLHSDVLSQRETAQSLLIAMVAVSEWECYAHQVIYSGQIRISIPARAAGA